jgi:hypothetical protein
MTAMLHEKTAGGCLFRKQNPPNFNVLPGQGCEGAYFG